MFAEDHPIHKGLVEADKSIQQETNGRIKFKIYSNGTYGEQQNSIQAVRMGTLDAFEAGPMPEYFAPAGAVYAPYAFRDYDHWDKFKKSDVANELLAKVGEGMGVVQVGVHQFGFRSAITTDLEAKTPDDFKGFKLRVVNVVPYSEVATILNAVGTPIPITDVYIALKTGVVNGTENPLGQIYTMKFHEVAKKLILTEHMISPGSFILSNKFWDSLSDADKTIVKAAFEKAAELTDQLVKQTDADYLQKLKDEGVTVIIPDKSKFQERAKLVLDKNPEWKEYFDKIQAIQ